MRVKGMMACFAVVGLLTGCGAEAQQPEHVYTIEQTVLPSDPDPSASKKAAQEFVSARANDDGVMLELGPAILRVYGEWEGDGGRAFIATSLGEGWATPENGRRIADAFAEWQSSKNGEGSVSVYGKDGERFFEGTF